MATSSSFESLMEITKDLQDKKELKCKISYKCGDSKVKFEVRRPSALSRLVGSVKKRFSTTAAEDGGDSSAVTPPSLPPRDYEEPYAEPNVDQQFPRYRNLPAMETLDVSRDHGAHFNQRQVQPCPRCFQSVCQDPTSTPFICGVTENKEIVCSQESEEDIYIRESTDTYIKLKQQREMNRLAKALEEAKGDKKGADYVIAFV